MSAFNLTQNSSFVMKSDEYDIFPHSLSSNNWNQHMIVGEYVVVGSRLATWYIAGAYRRIGSACVFKRNVNGDWTKEKELKGCYSNYKGTYCSYGQAVAIGVKDSNREFVVIKSGYAQCTSGRCSGIENVPEVQSFVSSGTSVQWNAKQSIVLDDWLSSTMNCGYQCSQKYQLKTFKNILLNDFATASKYYMVVHVSHFFHEPSYNNGYLAQDMKEEIRLYSNAAPGTDTSEWVLETSWYIHCLNQDINLALTFSGPDILVAGYGPGEKMPWPGSADTSDYSLSECAEVKVYDLNTQKEIQAISLPLCIISTIKLQANKGYLVVGDVSNNAAYVYEHSKDDAGVFVHVDTLKHPNLANPPYINSGRNFGKNVAINTNNDILVYASDEKSVNNTRGLLHRFIVRRDTCTQNSTHFWNTTALSCEV